MKSCSQLSQSCHLCQSVHKGVFADLSEKDLTLLDSCKTSNRYKRKQIIFYENNPILGVFFVRDGKVKLYKTSRDGKRQILKIAQAGDALGHSALFSDTPHATTAEIVEDANICFLDKAKFLMVLRSNPSVSVKLMEKLSKDLNQAQDQVLDLAYKSVRVRFVELLLTLKQSFGVFENGVYKLEISLSREELAEAIGTTEETAVRLISEFKSNDWIELDKKNILIKKLDELVQLTEFGY
jgi:CRP-like cAMP-binding protein